MSATNTPLTGRSTIGRWLDDASGGPILKKALSTTGIDTDSLSPARQLPLEQLAAMSQGRVTELLIDQVVRDANGGELPDDIEDESDAHSWKEKITSNRFQGKTVIVTGAGSGIGRATALRVAKEGGRVIAADISGDRLDALVAEHPDLDLIAAAGDIADDADVANIIALAGPRIDGLANVAGIMDNMTPLHEVSDAVWERVFRVNVTGLFKLSRAVIPIMLAASRGAIVNVASEAGLRGSSAGLAYTASKHAVVGITKSSAFMYGPSGLRVNTVAPGSTITNIQASFDSTLGEGRIKPLLALIPAPVEAARLAASITFLLSDDAVNLNGVILPSDGGQSVM
ncbi:MULTISPECIES: SDR family NAD(P)-dependent oxidoreductase [unclassified Frondihabitans]|uniref:SDR family NAD(P)-dependent oxidoreductase n=1 Tax=unclassified Frondihabitans TaxID=2626248 RepID=UPI000F503A68|nr:MULTISPECIES: SDR family NAD(P)-dependent oxidoreductase [unclassified Frondihabitans]RPE77808.1 NAD(P)-dependent dehydrogenase (short-subunit alcohol dehydrogenase family) [Frondihabitans sp. PhB153]RPF08087.1 NAD(P)-dependent dehydrogenase (short-subunit alcohol dehydrogenase family) [Frondihabitans sp. PhB161]